MAVKPLGYLLQQQTDLEDSGLRPVLTLFDLLMIGIASTVGTGVFSLASVIAAHDAGPAVIISWLVAGVSCLLTSFAYMELGSVVPSSGSVYAYSYCALGKVWAYLAAWYYYPIVCLLMELAYSPCLRTHCCYPAKCAML